MEKKQSLTSLKVIDIVQISLMAAMTYVATMLFNIPVGLGTKATFHIGDSMVFVAAILLGRKKGAFSSAVGMCLFDLLSPYAVWAPFTFIIKGTMAFIAGSIAYRSDYQGKNLWNNILAFAMGGIFMIAAYFASGVLLNIILVKANFTQSVVLSVTGIVPNIAQVLVGMAIALPLVKVLTNTKAIKNRG